MCVEDSIESQRRPNQPGLDMESLFLPASPCKPPVFDPNFTDSQPSEGLQVPPNEHDHSPPLPEDSLQSTLMQLFLSELQSHNPDGLLSGSGVFEKMECEVTDSGSTPPSILSLPPPPTSPALECIPTNLFTDPMDNPFLSSFTDIGLLQETTTLLSENAPLLMGGLDNLGPPSPVESNVNVTVVDSSNCDTIRNSQKIFDLSDCVNFLTCASTSHSSVPTSAPTSPSNTPSPPSALTSVPSPPSAINSTPSPSSTTSHTPLSFSDYDFSSLSDQDLASVVNSISSCSTTEPNSPSPSDTDVFLSQEQSPGSNSCVKRTAGGDSNQRLPSEKAPRVSSTSADDMPGRSENAKHRIRRDRNNEACRVSRAKRRHRRSDMKSRVEELELHNRRLKVQAEEMTAETHRLKKLLLERLAR